MSTALTACVFWAACLMAADPPGAPVPPKLIDAPILVQFDEAGIAQRDTSARTLEGLRTHLVEALGLSSETRLEETTLSRVLREESGDAVDFSRWMLLVHKLQPGQFDVLEDVVERLNAHELVSHAEADHDAFGWKPPAEVNDNQPVWPDDPLFPKQYYLRLIHAPEAWHITTGSEDVTVAILDAGCSPDLSELAGRMRPGLDFVGGEAKMATGLTHGTAITTIIAASGNNATAMAGIDWQCRIMPVVMTEGGVAVWAQAIEAATHAGVDIINISGKLECPEPSPILDSALEQAAAAGIVMVASAGNQNQKRIAWPAASPHVIAVGATDGSGHRWQDPMLGLGSNHGPGLDVVAPGQSIIALAEKAKTTIGAGTSPSAAMVSGACALMLAVNPALTPAEVRQILRGTADKIGPPECWHNGYNEDFGYGRLNVYEAVRTARQMAENSAEAGKGR